MLYHYVFNDMIVLPRDLIDVEIRIAGPSERHVEAFVVLGIIIRFKGVRKCLLVKMVVHPWMGTLTVLNIADLSSICEIRQAAFQEFRETMCSSSQSWLSCAIEFYVNFMRSSNSIMRYILSLSESLTNFAAFRGLSLKEIRHPTLPYSIVHDERIAEEETY